MHPLGDHEREHEEVAGDVAHFEFEHADLFHQEEEHAPCPQGQGQLEHHGQGKAHPIPEFGPEKVRRGTEFSAVMVDDMPQQNGEAGALGRQAGPCGPLGAHGGPSRCIVHEDEVPEDVHASCGEHGPHEDARPGGAHEEGIAHHEQERGEEAPFPDAHEVFEDSGGGGVAEDTCEAGRDNAGHGRDQQQPHEGGHPQTGAEDAEGRVRLAFSDTPGDEDLTGVAKSGPDHAQRDVHHASIARPVEGDIRRTAQKEIVGQDHQELHEGAGRDGQGQLQDGPVVRVKCGLHAEGGEASPLRSRSRSRGASLTVRAAQSPRMRGWSDVGIRQSRSSRSRTRRVTV